MNKKFKFRLNVENFTIKETLFFFVLPIGFILYCVLTILYWIIFK